MLSEIESIKDKEWKMGRNTAINITVVLIIIFTFLIGDALCAEDVTPIEDLMREHGVLRRVMLIYEKEIDGSEEGGIPQYDVIYKSAGIIHGFIEAYHEKLEEDYIFPIFEKAGKFTDLTKTLREQHEAGRRLTQSILRLSKEKRSGDHDNQNVLADSLRSFVKMYRPHAAREDTVLFPTLRTLISEKEYDALGGKFEGKERELFGEKGFEKIVSEVEDMEKSLGIYQLSQFTPRQ